MDTLYKPQGVEERWQQTWEEEGLYAADPDPAPRELGLLLPAAERHGQPPPGHALQVSLGDVLARWKRMQGLNVLVQAGYDHAGIATQNAVEKYLGTRGRAARARPRGVRRARVGVAARVRRRDRRPVPADGRLDGLPAQPVHDGRRLRPRRDAVVRPPLRARLDLPRQPDHQLVPAPPDVALRPRARGRRHGRRAHYVHYPLADGSGHITIATVRPATILADVAVAVHPDDERYRDLVGKEVIVPFVGGTSR